MSVFKPHQEQFGAIRGWLGPIKPHTGQLLRNAIEDLDSLEKLLEERDRELRNLRPRCEYAESDNTRLVEEKRRLEEQLDLARRMLKEKNVDPADLVHELEKVLGA